MKGGQETTFERIKDKKMENIAKEINRLEQNGTDTARRWLQVKDELELCREKLKYKNEALERAGERLGQNWRLI